MYKTRLVISSVNLYVPYVYALFWVTGL